LLFPGRLRETISKDLPWNRSTERYPKSAVGTSRPSRPVGDFEADLSPRSKNWNYQFIRNPWRIASPLRQGLGFQYTQP
jgi:hypothetical protein